MTRAFLGLGSNLGDRWSYLRDAVATLGPTVRTVSPVYETEPLGGPDQGSFLNVVVEVDTDLEPGALLGLCRRLEGAAARSRQERWGPRTLDVDILWIDGHEVDTTELQVPHPRMWQRRFVMAPLADLAPDVVPHGWEDRAEGRVRRVGTL